MYRSQVGRGRNNNWAGGNQHQRNYTNNGGSSSSSNGSSQPPSPPVFNIGSLSSGNSARAGHCSLEEAMECQVCLDVAVSPIYSCEGGGHILCYLCHDKLSLPKKCPSCSSQDLHVSPELERLAQRLEYKMQCPNAEAGCKVDVFSTSIGQHLKTCFFRDILCPLKACANVVAGISFKNFVASHLYEYHRMFPVENGEATSIPIPVNVEAERILHALIIFGNNNFLLRMQLTRSNYYAWMVTMGDDNQAKQHFVTISLYGSQKWPGNKATASWTLPIIPFHEDFSTEKENSKPVFGSMERKLFVSLVDIEDGHYTFDINVDICKLPRM